MISPDVGADEARAVLEARFAKKRLSAAAALFDRRGNLLIVQPTYREHWLLPGGVCEAGESPLTALKREVQEELGIEVDVERVICIDHLLPGGGFGESLHVLFECAVLDDDRIAAIRLDEQEIADYLFVAPALWEARLAPPILRRLNAVRAFGGVYCQDGQAVAPLGGDSLLRRTWPAG